MGPSVAMSNLWAQVRRLAPHVRTVLLSGTPDCGQQAVARLLLDLSPAPKRRFVEISAFDAEMRESNRYGFGSLPADAFVFLPDVDLLPLGAAAEVLGLIRMRRARPFTIVAAATQDLRALAAAGRFPAELAHSLTSVSIEMPKLEQRREDIPMLLAQLLSVRAPVAGVCIPTMTDTFLRAAMHYAWPGNLTELFSLTDSILEVAEKDRELTASDFHRVLEIQQNVPTFQARPVRMLSLDAVAKEHVNSVLHACGGNKLRAAEVLGISRSTLYRMLDSAVPRTTLSMAS